MIWLRSSCAASAAGRKGTVKKNDHLINGDMENTKLLIKNTQIIILVEQVQKGKRITNYYLNIKHTSRSEEFPEKQSQLKCPVPKKPLSPRSFQRSIMRARD